MLSVFASDFDSAILRNRLCSLMHRETCCRSRINTALVGNLFDIHRDNLTWINPRAALQVQMALGDQSRWTFPKIQENFGLVPDPADPLEGHLATAGAAWLPSCRAGWLPARRGFSARVARC